MASPPSSKPGPASPPAQVWFSSLDRFCLLFCAVVFDPQIPFLPCFSRDLMRCDSCDDLMVFDGCLSGFLRKFDASILA